MSFLALALELKGDDEDPAALAELAADGYARALAAQPGIRPSERSFLRVLSARRTRDLSVEDFGEVGLMAACVDNHPRANEILEREYVSAAGSSLARLKLSSSERDEIMQRVRAKLLVASDPNELPLLATYVGSGRLRSFIRVVATREALSFLRSARPGADDAELDELAAPMVDPALEALAARSRAAMKQGFERAVGALASRERNILRMHFLDGVELGAIARLYGVHRVTASRWLADIRERLVTTVREHVQRELALTESDVDSVVRLARQDLDASVERLLRAPSVERSGA
ncbi:MAG: hypothetical protein U0271_27990 [Polyangiaceae bacterium]